MEFDNRGFCAYAFVVEWLLFNVTCFKYYIFLDKKRWSNISWRPSKRFRGLFYINLGFCWPCFTNGLREAGKWFGSCPDRCIAINCEHPSPCFFRPFICLLHVSKVSENRCAIQYWNLYLKIHSCTCILVSALFFFFN